MQGNVPNLDTDSINRASQEANDMLWYADSTLGKYERYQKELERRFPGWEEVQDGYYALDPKLRDQYLIDNPMLQEKWDYDNAVKRANPDLSVLINNSSAGYKVYDGTYDSITNAIMGRISSSTRDRLDNYIERGWALPAWAERDLRTAYGSMIPDMETNVPYEEWIKGIVE